MLQKNVNNVISNYTILCVKKEVPKYNYVYVCVCYLYITWHNVENRLLRII